jgi:hypothetical protein
MTVRRTANCLARNVPHEQPDVFTLEELLLELSLCDFNLNRFVNLLRVPAFVIGVVLDSGREEGIDEGCLSEAGFTSNLGFVSHDTQGIRGESGVF